MNHVFEWLYRKLYRWGFKASNKNVYRLAWTARLIMVIGAGALILLGLMDFPVWLFIAISSFALVWTAYVWRMSHKAGIELDLVDFILDCILIVILLRYTGGSQSPFIFFVYLWVLGMFATNIRLRTWRPMVILSIIAYGLLIIGGWKSPSFAEYVLVHGMGMIILMVVTYFFTYEILRREVDELTGTLTRLTGLEALQEWMELKPGFHLVFLDLNKFKKVNDQYGHLVGDKILAEVGSRLRSRFRKNDLVIRYGGDEFLIASEAPDLEERVQKCFHKPFPIRNGSIHIGASIGCIQHIPEESLDELLQRVDMLLLNQKRQRNDGRSMEGWRKAPF